MSTDQFPYPRHHIRRMLLRGLSSAALTLLCDFKVIGKENIPKAGPLLIAANHFHYGDPVAVASALPFPFEFVGGFQRPNAPKIVQWIPELWDIYSVRRGGASSTAMRAVMAVIAQNGVVCIFPEGGSWADVLRPARPGLAYLAVTTGAPILPIGIDGLIDLFPKLRQGKRATVTLRIGKPCGPFAVEGRGRARRDKLDEVGDEIMRQIATLLPPQRHGVYSTEPHLREAAEKVAVYPYEDLHG